MKLEELGIKTTETVHHVRIIYKKDEYFFIVTVLKVEEYGVIVECKRGVTWWDCRKPLKNSEKKRINKLITEHFRK